MLLLIAAMLLTLFAVGTYIHIYVQNCMYVFMCVHAYTLGLCLTLKSGMTNAYMYISLLRIHICTLTVYGTEWYTSYSSKGCDVVQAHCCARVLVVMSY